MYFLVKNIRSCTKSFGKIPDKTKLYKNGILNWEYLARNLSYFVSHPEQIRQQLKEKDAHMLCQFFDSEEYKKRVTEFLETQGRLLAKDTIAGTKPSKSIKYQHVLSCAQPLMKNSKLFTEENKPETKESEDGSRRKRIRRGTIFEEMVKRRCRLEGRHDCDFPVIKSESRPKVVKQRSTIMPIFLKKIKKRLQKENRECEYAEAERECEPAKKPKGLTTAKECEPLYAQLLHKSPIKTSRSPVQRQMSCCYILDNATPPTRPATASGSETRSVKYPYKMISRQQPSMEMNSYTKPQNPQAEKPSSKLSMGKNILDRVEPPSNNNRNSGGYKLSGLDHYSLNKTNSKLESIPMKLSSPSNVVPLRMASSTAKMCSKMPSSRLYPKKKMNLKSFSDFLCIQNVNPQKIRKDKPVKEINDSEIKIKVLKPRKQDKNTKNEEIPKKETSMQLLVNEMQTKRSLKSLKFDNKLEKKNTMMMIMKNRERTKRGGNVKAIEMLSLFHKVKMGMEEPYIPRPNVVYAFCYALFQFVLLVASFAYYFIALIKYMLKKNGSTVSQ